MLIALVDSHIVTVYCYLMRLDIAMRCVICKIFEQCAVCNINGIFVLPTVEITITKCYRICYRTAKYFTETSLFSTCTNTSHFNNRTIKNSSKHVIID